MLIHLRTRTAAAAFTLAAVTALLFLLPTSYFPSSPFHRRPPPQLDVPPLPEAYADLLPDLRLPRALEAHPLLHSRLHAFLSRPVRSYDDATPLNERKCPRELSDRLANPDQVHGDWEFWHDEVDEGVIRGKRVEMVRYLADVLERGDRVVWDAPRDDGKAEQAEYLAEVNPDIASRAPTPPQRGFVSAAGNSDTTQRLLTLLRILRKHYRVDLPFEVWTFPGELSPEGAEYRELTQELGATVHEAQGLTKDEGAWKNFQIKGLAITSSSFREVIYLDSDNIPLRDPSHLFASARYTEGGQRAAFWPDLSKDHVDNAIWRIIGDECDLEDWTFESGQIVIDKVRPQLSCSHSRIY
jgi:alpha 1,2-mannosyltransferase